jgi:glycosyltransferase involved in cell wall biosynthesis
MRRPLILHITGDYPDPTRDTTTEAIKRLIDRLTMYDHIIVSLHRTADPRAVFVKECPAPAGQRLFGYRYFGLPLGAAHYASFRIVAERIKKLLAAEDLRPDVIHAHKLTFEGIAGWKLSQHFGIPHLISVRGEVESKIFRFKPTYRPLMTRIVADAAKIYYVSAWYEPALTAATGLEPGKSRPLPNIVNNSAARIDPRPPKPVIVTAANFDIYRKKGIDRLIPAFALAASSIPGVSLEIYGGGKASSEQAVRGLIHQAERAHPEAAGRIVLKGRVPNAAFLAALPHSLAMALPSHNETFGMVYTEALFAGIPVLYSLGTGIDGYLRGLDVGVGVDPTNTDAIAAALVTLVRDNSTYRATIAAASGTLFERFDPDTQISLYVDDVKQLIQLPKLTGRKLSPSVDADVD